jgi:predicted helicase
MHFDLYGKREYKYKYLWEASLSTINFNELENREPNYFFINKSTIGEVAYNKGFKIDEIFILYASGIKTQRDDASIKLTQFECDEIKRSFLELTNEQLKLKYGFKDVRDWTIDSARNDLNRNKIIENRIAYRPFDNRFMNYTGKTKGIQGYPRLEVMKHLIENNNICLLTCRQQSTFDFQHIFITSYVSDMCTISSQTKEGSYAFPLYLQNEISEGLLSQKQADRFPNLKQEIIDEICETLQFSFTIEKDNSENTFSPIDILDYIYAVLHSPSYREKYKEFLKIDFPRIPYPTDKESFWKLVELGSELRQVHLMESPALNKLITKYPVSGNNEITTLKYQAGKIFINDQQYFDLVPETSWNFYIGGYQPAQKWLKDRKGRILTFEDILHYQKIIVALSETERLMNKIDDLEFY